MAVRILMATVAALALAAPAVAQDQSVPTDTEQSATPETEQMQEGLQEQQGTEGGGEQAPAMTEETPAQTEGAPSMVEEESDPAESDEAPAMTEEMPADQPADQETAEEATPPPSMEFLQVQEEQQFLADDEVIGKDVVNDMGEKVGSIADLVMDQDQKLVGVVLSVGGFLGIGEKWVAVPVEQIDFPTPEEPARLLATVTEEQLTNAPDFTTRAALEAEQAASDAAMQQQPAPAAPPAQ
jgi:PRC-barrel domain